ncbi:hypothetical protein PROFUN_00828 [Planoprotostelium fungivorum]|uniref:DUF4395 domain-containing protein n=1 Tax=Planoprotostelium fungivorum TaxID=1890364 RepID=A0A2P6P040_9EUKA|nr:hypothetical protein PROFUN_00828 [Planoprotostelium fungivorum]
MEKSFTERLDKWTISQLQISSRIHKSSGKIMWWTYRGLKSIQHMKLAIATTNVNIYDELRRPPEDVTRHTLPFYVQAPNYTMNTNASSPSSWTRLRTHKIHLEPLIQPIPPPWFNTDSHQYDANLQNILSSSAHQRILTSLTYSRSLPWNDDRRALRHSAMDPRLCWTDAWSQPLSTFFYAACLWTTAGCITCIARLVITISRRGFSRSLDVLLFPEVLASAVLVAYSFGMATSNGRLPVVVSEMLFSLPPALNAGSHATFAAFLILIHRASPDRLKKPTTLYKRAAIIGGMQTIIVLSGFIAGVVYLHFHPQNGRWSYLISASPVAVVLLGFVVTILHLMRALEKKSSRFRRKIWMSVRYCLLYQIIWIVSFVAYVSSYYNITSISSPAAWMTLLSLQLFSTVSSMNEICKTLSKDQFTAEGIQMLKPKLIITVPQSGASKDAVVRVADESISESNSAGPRCESGVCPPIHIVNLATAREIAAPVWKRPPTKWSDLFTFPHPVNENEARIHAVFVCIMCGIIMIVGAVRPEVSCWWLYAYMLFGFVARFAAGPRFDPQAWFIVVFIVPRLHIKPIYVAGPPKRFAQFCGVVCCSASFVLYMVEQRIAAFWILGMLLVLSFVQARHDICVGCFAWHLFSLTGLMSEGLVTKSTAAFQVQEAKASAINLTIESQTTASSQVAQTEEVDNEPG